MSLETAPREKLIALIIQLKQENQWLKQQVEDLEKQLKIKLPPGPPFFVKANGKRQKKKDTLLSVCKESKDGKNKQSLETSF